MAAMQQPRSKAPLVAGLLLVIIGVAFLMVRLVQFEFDWAWFRFVLPVLLLIWGLTKLIRHFTLDVSVLVERPGKAGLLGGFFWSAVGIIWILDLIGVLEGFEFFGLYWPVLLILFGLGKIIDFHRSNGRLQVRVGEILGAVCLVLVGLGSALVADAQFPLISLPSEWSSRVEIDDWLGQKYDWTESESVEVGDLRALHIENLYGNVAVTAGESNRIEIELTKSVLAEDEAEAKQVADRVALVLDREKGVLQVGTNRGEVRADKKLFKSHLRLRLPSNLPVSVSNRYGDVRVRGLEAACDIKNAYGEVLVEKVIGQVQIETQYRRVSLREVEGTVTVRNDRGSIVAEDGTGDFDAQTAYDALVVRRQDGSVKLKNRFGRVRLESITGDAEVQSPGSEVNVSEVEGALTLQASHKTVSITGLGGKLDLTTANNRRVTLTQIEGPVQIRGAYSDIQASELAAGLRVEAKGTRVVVEDLEGGFDVSSSTRPVRVVHFGGGGTIQNQYGEIELIADRQLEGDLTLTTKNADITLVLPEDVSARISAQAPGGRIVSEFNREAEQELTVLDTQLGRGGPRVRLRTDYAGIYIKKAP